MSMFCYQCEQTAKGSGCTSMGVCGKTPTVAALQDLLVTVAMEISYYADQARGNGKSDIDVDRFVVKALFTTVTNVNFDPARIEALLKEAEAARTKAREMAAGGDGNSYPGAVVNLNTIQAEALLAPAAEIGLAERKSRDGDVVVGLQELAIYGLKGAAAYANHAEILGKEDPTIYADFHQQMAWLGSNPTDVEALTGAALAVGELNMRVMALLDDANTSTYGHPEPTPVRVTPRKGKCILVSGHDLKDLEELLKQTEGKGIDIYTHGEMLPAHGYPKLKKYSHLAGNYGGAWQDQAKEFDAFPGAILMTTNCIQKPRESYQPRIFTTGLVAWPGVTHLESFDFGPVIDSALAADGFTEDGAEQTILVGFGHNAVLGAAGKVVELVKAGKIKHFFLVGGCDGAKSGRNYYTDFAQQIPDDCLVLTLACGKYRFNKLDFGDIDGIPRLLDIGQCNDAHSALQIAIALAGAFECDVNDLPLSMVLSWYEQKAVAILLTLLHLGIKNIRIGPSLPAFITPPVLDVLVDNFALTPVTTPEADLEAILGQPQEG
jgi:hydroxylamine reductase